MKILVLQSGFVGREISRFLLEEFPNDEHAIVSLSRSPIGYLKDVENVREVILDEPVDLRIYGFEKPDLGVLAWWPSIIHRPLLDWPVNGFINLHPSYLPFGRGKDPNFWTFLDDVPYGVSIHIVDDKVDHGPVIARQEIIKSWEDTGESLYLIARQACVELFRSKWSEIRGAAQVGQLGEIARSFPASTVRRRDEIVEASRIDLDEPTSARKVLNILRARTFAPHPAAWFEDDGEQYEVRVDISRKKREK